MQASTGIVTRLNRILLNELTAVNQYFLHSRMVQNWGYDILAKREYEESLDEMRHADLLMQRILMLEGLPNLQDLGRLRIGENVPEILNCDLDMEMEGRRDLIDSINHCEEVQDYVTRELCQKILTSEEEHIDWLEMQLQLIEDIGEVNYLHSQMTP